MSLKSDHWIRRMAAAGMIEPFAPEQVRVNNNGERVISYGTSSYGYDVRCADEFKIFTNINSSIVDPKAFDDKSFVDLQADVCIIPPNSFALARTVEYLRVPRSVLILCLGKSTYARCFSADTRVALLDGRTPTLEEMAIHAADGELFCGYSVNTDGRIIATDYMAPRYIGRDQLIAITLDSGVTVRCTPDHKWLLRNGQMLAAHQLRVGTSLMPLYRAHRSGTELVYQPTTQQFSSADSLVNEWQRRLFADQTSDNHDQMTIPSHTVYAAPVVCTQRIAQQCNNHQIVAIRELAGDHDVYCLTVPETGNFALAAGVFVANCGIIVNTTPLEPEWEGHITLEFSNTTPLPAKIYANEGVAQLLFLEADEICACSYRDRNGKYQGQRGVTLPKP